MPLTLDPAAIDVVASLQVAVLVIVMCFSFATGLLIVRVERRRRHAERRQRTLVDLYAYAERLRRHTEATRQADLFQPQERRND